MNIITTDLNAFADLYEQKRQIEEVLRTHRTEAWDQLQPALEVYAEIFGYDSGDHTGDDLLWHAWIYREQFIATAIYKDGEWTYRNERGRDLRIPAVFFSQDRDAIKRVFIKADLQGRIALLADKLNGAIHDVEMLSGIEKAKRRVENARAYILKSEAELAKLRVELEQCT